MNETLRLSPLNASSVANDYDVLFYSWLGLSAFVIVGIIITGIVFSVRYRRGSKASRLEPGDKKRNDTLHKIEYTWIAIPLALFLIMFFLGAKLYSTMLNAPENALEIYVVAKQWMWKLQHPQGKREINELHVPLGIPIKLVMTSQDVIHSFYIPAFRVKQDVVPGRYLTTWFEATKTGRFRFMCAEYCGAGHSEMHGHLVVMQPEQFEEWLQSGPLTQGSLAEQGKEKFLQYGCNACHEPGSSVHAPVLRGLFGRQVMLQDGTTIIADERYIHDSIVQPRKQVVQGYDAIMPSFEGQISEEEIIQIIAYIKSLTIDSETAQ